MENFKLPSLHDVARRAGVSLSSASRSLDESSSHPVSSDLRARVQQAASQLGYEPNLLARGLRNQLPNLVAILIHDISDPYFADVIRGVTQAASRQSWLTMICDSRRSSDVELQYIEMLSAMRVGILIFAGGEFLDPTYQQVARLRFSYVRRYGGVIVALTPRNERMPTERPDDLGGARLATGHLLALGHRRICMIAGPTQLTTNRLRVMGYEKEMAEAGLPTAVVHEAFSMAGGADGIDRLLAVAPDLTAVFAGTDIQAIGAVQELRRQGRRVPQDVSVVGFDDIAAAQTLDPPLTTVCVPFQAIAACGFDRAFQLLSEKSDDASDHVHPVELVIRESTSNPRLL